MFVASMQKVFRADEKKGTFFPYEKYTPKLLSISMG